MFSEIKIIKNHFDYRLDSLGAATFSLLRNWVPWIFSATNSYHFANSGKVWKKPSSWSRSCWRWKNCLRKVPYDSF